MEAYLGITIWYFVASPSGPMMRFPAARMNRFLDGHEALPEYADAVHVVEVIVEIQGRRALRVQRVICPRFKITQAGLCDPEHQDEAVNLAMRVLDFDALVRPENVEELDTHLARRDTRLHHRWNPSPSQLQDVANLLNAAAVVPPVVAVVGSELMPL